MEKISINKLKINIDGKKVLDNVSFDLKKGETLIIIGESGSGKTILSKLLVGLKPENAEIIGNITFDEKNLLKISEKEWSKYRGEKISYISQNPMSVFNSFQNIESHVVELFKSRLGLSKKECVNKIIDGMKRLNLPHQEELLKKYPFQLSGGMLQRIMFAMMMQLEPDLLIADEPTSALDYYNTEKIAEILKKLQSQETALIVITHDYDFARQLGGKMIILKEGKLIESGETKDLLESPKTEYGKALILRKRYKRYKKSGGLA